MVWSSTIVCGAQEFWHLCCVGCILLDTVYKRISLVAITKPFLLNSISAEEREREDQALTVRKTVTKVKQIPVALILVIDRGRGVIQIRNRTQVIVNTNMVSLIPILVMTRHILVLHDGSRY